MTSLLHSKESPLKHIAIFCKYITFLLPGQLNIEKLDTSPQHKNGTLFSPYNSHCMLAQCNINAFGRLLVLLTEVASFY